MPLPTIFAALSVASGGQLDACLAALGVLTTIPCSVAGTNALALSPEPLTPTTVAYADFQGFSCVAVGTNTGAVTAAVGGLATLNVYKDTSGGPVVLVGGEIVTGNLIILYYDPSLDSGAGGFHLGGPGAPAVPPGGAAAVLVEGGAAEKISAMTAASVPAAGMPFVAIQITGDAHQDLQGAPRHIHGSARSGWRATERGYRVGPNANASGNGANLSIGANSGTGPTGTGGALILSTGDAPAAGVTPGDILVVLSTGGTRAALVKIQDSGGAAVLPTSDPGIINAIYQDGSGNLKISI